MLYLRHMDDEVVESPVRYALISERIALRIERALLAADEDARSQELTALLAHEPDIAQWAFELITRRTGRAPATVDEAAASLSKRLVAELAAALTVSQDEVSQPTGVAWRLPALVARLQMEERRASDFDRRLEYEKIESLKELAYGASHEINNPLANIAARAQTLLDDEVDSERRRKLHAIHRQALRAHEMIADLMLFARPPKLRLAACNLCPLVDRVVNEHRETAAERQIQLDCQLGDEPLELAADDTQLAVAIGAVVANAIEAVGAGGHVQVFLQAINDAGQKWAEIVVRDDGPGISPEVRRHMFDPFFSGREAGRGLGFGLSKCWRIVTDHGGRVVVHDPPGRGAEIAIQLKMAADERG